jgi:hypothetical protein
VISLFSTGDFIRVSLKEGPFRAVFGAVSLLMGVAIVDDHPMGIVNGSDGDMGLVPLDDIASDFIYDVEKDRFIDRSAIEQEDVPLDDSFEE